VALAAGKADELKTVAAECEKLGGQVETVALRPSSKQIATRSFTLPSTVSAASIILVVGSGKKTYRRSSTWHPSASSMSWTPNVTSRG